MTKDSLLFVGYEESSGTVLSVAGVTVLGIRGAYSSPVLAEKKPDEERRRLDYKRGWAQGYADCKASIARGVLETPDAMAVVGSPDFKRGYVAGWLKCKKDSTPAPISAPQPHTPSPANAAPSSPSQGMFNLAVRGW